MDKAETISARQRDLLATVKGDVHDIGKNLVEIILSNNGYLVINLGHQGALPDVLIRRHQGAQPRCRRTVGTAREECADDGAHGERLSLRRESSDSSAGWWRGAFTELHDEARSRLRMSRRRSTPKTPWPDCGC